MIEVTGNYMGWSVFVIADLACIDEVLPWCESNLGRRFRGFMGTAFGWRLSNWGTWVYETRTYHEVGLCPEYVRVFLRRPEDIALFKLRWS